MAMFLDTFRVPPTHHPLQIIQYDGPPKPKQPSQRNLSKIPFSEDWARSNAERENKEDLVLTSDEVELVDLTYLADEEGNCEISGSGGGESGDVGSDDGSSPMTEREGVSMPTSREDTGDKASHQPAPSEGSSQGNTVVIKDSQSHSDTDEVDFHEDDAGSRIGDQLKVSSISTPEYHGREFPAGTKDAITPETGDGVKTQISELPRRKLPSTPPTSPSMMNIEQSTQESIRCILLKATTHQPQRPMEKKTETEVGLPTIESTSSSSSSSSGSDADDDDRSSNHTTSLARKRKRPPPTTGHIRTSNKSSKQRPKHNAHSLRQRKPSLIRGRPNRPSALEPLSAAQYSGHDATTRSSGERSGASSEDSTDHSTDHSACHLASNKRPMLTARPVRPYRHKRKRSRGSADEEDDEYEVEMILDARFNRRKLQYQVKWLEYEDDPVWYDAGNFKNSPHKLRSFHTANPLCPGPPKRLRIWVQCWEEDRDADDHPDDNKPERSHTGGGML